MLGGRIYPYETLTDNLNTFFKGSRVKGGGSTIRLDIEVVNFIVFVVVTYLHMVSVFALS